MKFVFVFSASSSLPAAEYSIVLTKWMLTVHFMGIVFMQWQPRLKKCAWCNETQSNPQTNCSEASVTFKELGLVFGVQKAERYSLCSQGPAEKLGRETSIRIAIQHGKNNLSVTSRRKRELFVLHWHLRMFFVVLWIETGGNSIHLTANWWRKMFQKNGIGCPHFSAFSPTDTYMAQWCSHTRYHGYVHCRCNSSFLCYSALKGVSAVLLLFSR